MGWLSDRLYTVHRGLDMPSHLFCNYFQFCWFFRRARCCLRFSLSLTHLHSVYLRICGCAHWWIFDWFDELINLHKLPFVVMFTIFIFASRSLFARKHFKLLCTLHRSNTNFLSLAAHLTFAIWQAFTFVWFYLSAVQQNSNSNSSVFLFARLFAHIGYFNHLDAAKTFSIS